MPCIIWGPYWFSSVEGEPKAELSGTWMFSVTDWNPSSRASESHLPPVQHLTLRTWYPSDPPPGISTLWDPPISTWRVGGLLDDTAPGEREREREREREKEREREFLTAAHTAPTHTHTAQCSGSFLLMMSRNPSASGEVHTHTRTPRGARIPHHGSRISHPHRHTSTCALCLASQQPVLRPT